jgi:hypothetical protein
VIFSLKVSAILEDDKWIRRIINPLGAEYIQNLHVFTLNFIIDLVKGGLLPQIAPIFFSKNFLNFQSMLGQMFVVHIGKCFSETLP